MEITQSRQRRLAFPRSKYGSKRGLRDCVSTIVIPKAMTTLHCASLENLQHFSTRVPEHRKT